MIDRARRARARTWTVRQIINDPEGQPRLGDRRHGRPRRLRRRRRAGDPDAVVPVRRLIRPRGRESEVEGKAVHHGSHGAARTVPARDGGMVRVTVWGENVHERTEEHVRAIYPDGMHARDRRRASARLGDGVRVRTATLRGARARPHAGGARRHRRADLVGPRGARRRRRRGGRPRRRTPCSAAWGCWCCTPAHYAKVFRRLLGTSCSLRWRNEGERELVWTVDPAHPIAAGVPHPIVIDAQEMYGEHFDIPAPDELVFVSSFAGGEVFRGGCCFRRGRGRIFYFSPGDQDYPVYHHPDVQRVLANAVGWAAPAAAGTAARPTPQRPARVVRGMSFATITGSAPLRGVVAGAGKLGPYWASELVASPDTELAGWVDLNAERVRAEADAMGLATAAHRATRSRRMLERERPDFLVNVTAPAAHHPVTIGRARGGPRRAEREADGRDAARGAWR